MATSGKEWRKAREQGVPTVLPSGMEADIRPIEVDFFLMIGKVPDIMAPLINKIISSESTYRMVLPESEQIAKHQEWVQFLKDLCVYAFVRPKVVEAPQADDEIAYEDIAFVDKMQVFFNFANPAQRSQRFREKQTELMAALELAKRNGAVAVKDPQN